MHDAHCHLDYMANGEDVARDAKALGISLFANTVTPDGYAAARKRFAPYDNVTVGFGIHPWWIEGLSPEEVAESLETACRAHVDGTRFPIGEVGLDFGPRHIDSKREQLEIFEAIATTAAYHGALLSIHSVRVARETLDILKTTGALDACACVFHWFSGPSDLLKRAIDANCLFSVGPRMLATGKGREYVKAIPASRLMLETDYPPHKGDTCSCSEIVSELEGALATVSAIKGTDMLETMDVTFARALG